MEKKHEKRMGIGCRHEFYEADDELPFCEFALKNFGMYQYCFVTCKNSIVAKNFCWLDIKETKKFEGDKHCPNCSTINQPRKLVRKNKYEQACSVCGFIRNDSLCFCENKI